MYPDDFRYTKEHEWVRAQGDVASVGITDHAQSELGGEQVSLVDRENRGAMSVLLWTREHCCAKSASHSDWSGTSLADG